MHTMQIVLLEDSNPLSEYSDIADLVTAYLEEPLSDWYDWFTVVDTPNPLFKYEALKGGVLKYSDNPDEFMRMFNEFVQRREDVLQRLLEEADYPPVLDVQGNPISAPNGWAIQQIGEIACGTWTNNSFLYDLTAGGDTNTLEFLKRLATNPENQYLVLVDFHS